jgi:transcriptional regulator with XRE-family HTH domain
MNPNPPGDNPTVARLQLGARLRELRLAAGISGDRAGAALRATGSKISRVEGGHVPVRGRDVTDLLKLYRVSDPGVRNDLLALADQSAGQGWWDAYADTMPATIRRALELEAAASMLVTYDPLAVPAVLQTVAYSKAACALRGPGVCRAGLGAEELARRHELLSSPAAPRLWALVDEAALRRPVAEPGVMSGQVAYLADIADKPTVTIQVVPAGIPVAATAATPFTIARFARPDLPDRILIELLTTIVSIDRRADVDTYWAQVMELAAQIPTPEDSKQILASIAAELATAA